MGAESFRPTETPETTTSTEAPNDQRVNNGITTINNLRGGPRQQGRTTTRSGDMETATFTREPGAAPERVTRPRGTEGAWRTEKGSIVGNIDNRVVPDTAENTTPATPLNNNRTETPAETIPQPEASAENRPITTQKNLSGAARQQGRTTTRSGDMETATFTREPGAAPERVTRPRGTEGAWRTEKGSIVGNIDNRVVPDTAENTTPATPLNNNRTETPVPRASAAPQRPSDTTPEEPTAQESGFKGVSRPPQPAARVIPRVGMDGRRLN